MSTDRAEDAPSVQEVIAVAIASEHGYPAAQWRDYADEADAVLAALAAEGLAVVEPERFEALFRWLLDEGHMTPVARMQLRKLLVPVAVDDRYPESQRKD